MPEAAKKSANLGDPVRLGILHASFRAADDAWRGQNRVPDRMITGEADEGERLAGAFRRHFESLDRTDLETSRVEFAQGFLQELDRKMAAPGEPPGERIDASRLSVAAEAAPPSSPKVGLVSLPWMSPAMPSIQLATLAAALNEAGIESDVHELYVDYAARIGLNLYNHLGNLLGYLPEWVFSRHYYGREQGDDLAAMMAQRPLDEIPWPELSDAILDALEPVTASYLTQMVEAVDWSRYDVLGFSLTISQLGASMAFSRLIKLRHPEIHVVFGGSQCAGVMGRAILRACPYIDTVVHVEGELVLAELVERVRGERSLADLPGVSRRGPAGEIVTGPSNGLYRSYARRPQLSYDAYFHRLQRLGLLDRLKPWLPFEGSRGCWYGQKTQCTFCGLHEIMEFRAWESEGVLVELERLYRRYGIGRFYAMDLILPRDYLSTLLPEIARREHPWMFFWEIKSNMKREELETLAAAGVRWVQPGIESLDADLLRLMKKGVSPIQNIQLLKWCEELGIFCGWNLLTGLPGETAAPYGRMVELIPKLHHLKPPSGGGRFQLHRFSPYFERPKEYGLRWTGAHPMFRHAFPLPQQELDELVYLHEFELESGEKVDSSAAEATVRDWRRAYHGGSTLHMTVEADGTSRIEDARRVDLPPLTYELDADEKALYRFLDKSAVARTVAQSFQSAHPEAESLRRSHAVEACLRKWLNQALIIESEGRLLALAIPPKRAELSSAYRSSTDSYEAAPVVFDSALAEPDRSPTPTP